jgi:hypothetical protein
MYVYMEQMWAQTCIHTHTQRERETADDEGRNGGVAMLALVY